MKFRDGWSRPARGCLGMSSRLGARMIRFFSYFQALGKFNITPDSPCPEFSG
jgi:hypothetical protein